MAPLHPKCYDMYEGQLPLHGKQDLGQFAFCFDEACVSETHLLHVLKSFLKEKS